MGRLILVLGDQLSLDCVLPEDHDPDHDRLWMAESGAEARRVWSHRARIALFLAAMRHFRDAAREAGHTVIYRQDESLGIADLLSAEVERERPETLVLTRPGDWHLLQELQACAERHGIPLYLREDPHFLTTPADFADWAEGRKQPRMEYFYREQRRRFGILVDEDGEPLGGQWNFDADNRASFGRDGPGEIPAPSAFEPDRITAEVLEEVARRHDDHPGSLEAFDWPVTPAAAREALADFVEHRLADFGRHQDAMWTGETWLWHSRLSAAMNLHLLDPREVIEAAVRAHDEGAAPIEAVEGFVRQILGWREYVRGIYWRRMPGWETENHFEADQPLPDFYWTGDTDMVCLQDALASTLRTGYAHHIQRLMVTGLFGLLLGVKPSEIEAWYHAIYVDAVAWVELPNTLGMSQFVDGGVLASKPYVASGAYIQRMSNACSQCRYKPKQRHGEDACPYTVLYWDFLMRHESRLRPVRRMAMQLRNLQRLDDEEREQIRDSAEALRQRF